MGIHLAGEKTGGRDIKAISAFIVLASSDQVVEAPEMGSPCHPEAFPIGEQAHRTLVEPFMDLQSPIQSNSDEQHAVGSVRRQHEADSLLDQPGSKTRIRNR